MLSEVGCSVPTGNGMKACLPPSAPSCHSRQKRRSLSFHSTSTDSSSQPAPNRADAFIVGSPPRLKVPFRLRRLNHVLLADRAGLLAGRESTVRGTRGPARRCPFSDR